MNERLVYVHPLSFISYYVFFLIVFFVKQFISQCREISLKVASLVQLHEDLVLAYRLYDRFSFLVIRFSILSVVYFYFIPNPVELSEIGVGGVKARWLNFHTRPGP